MVPREWVESSESVDSEFIRENMEKLLRDTAVTHPDIKHYKGSESVGRW